ncbi:MAG TPA: elongation factor 1-beta [Thermoplasmata archaeon]|nr:elongation factor 1-beta [Thermoplasmata archaeon]
MGKVAVTFRILPEGSEVDVAEMESSVRRSLGGVVRDLAVRPVAFGLQALEATLVLEDEAGQAEQAEEALRRIAGVGEVETLGVSLL